MIERHATEYHADALRRAEARRRARGAPHARPVRLRLARGLVSVAGRLDPDAPVVVLPRSRGFGDAPVRSRRAA